MNGLYCYFRGISLLTALALSGTGCVLVAHDPDRCDADPDGCDSDTDVAPWETDVTDTDVVDTDVIDTDAADTDVVDTDPADTDPADTDVVDTDVLDTDVTDTDVIDTDTNVVDTDVVDTDSGSPGVPPRVIDTNVYSTSLAVATNRAITATFDLAMDGGSVLGHFEITPSVPLVTPYFDVGANALVFAPPPLAPSIGLGPATPLAFLEAETTYTVTVFAGALDLLGAALEDDYVWTFTTGTDINERPIEMGLMASIALMGNAVVGTAPPTALTGGLASIGALSGFTDLEAQVSGTVYSPTSDGVVPAGMIADYDVVAVDARDRNTAPILPFSAAISVAAPLAPGLYYAAPAVTLAADVILDAGGDRDATFIFQVTGAFGLAAGVEVLLQGGADPANVFWQSDGAINLGANAILRGTVVTNAAVTTGADAQVQGGRILTKAGSVTLGAANLIAIPE